MRILVVSQYFWPENFRINDLVAELGRRGHTVTVLTGEPNYPGGTIFPEFKTNRANFDQYERSEVVRVKLLPRGHGGLRLMLNYLSFCFFASIAGPWMLRGRSFDAIFVFQPSPITVGVPAIILKWFKRAPIAFWVLDLWPQSLEAVGAVRSKFVLALVDGLVRFVYSQSDMILAQSKSFVEAISRQIKDPARIVYFPSWAEPSPSIDDAEPAPEVPRRDDLFTVVFTGNVGEAQDFSAILVAAEALREEPVRWVVVGDGRKSAWLAEEIKARGLGAQILMAGRHELNRMPSFLRLGDALLVSLRDEPIFALTIPGKLQTYLSAGRPILAMLNGEGAELVRSAGAGIAVAAGDGLGLAGAIGRMMSMDKSDRLNMGQNGRACLAMQFNRDKLIDDLEQRLAQLARRH